ncbi:MAG: YkvA family protein [Chloroflexota bacterium]
MNLVVAIAVGIVAAWILLLIVFWLVRPKDVSIRELARLVPDLVRMLRSIGGDRETPLDVRLVLIGLLAWIVSPIDLIPEFIPVLGPMDDVVVTIAALRYVRRRVGVETMRARWPGSADGFALLGRVVGIPPA